MKKNLMLTNMKRLVMAVMLCAFALGGKAQTAVTINPSNRLQTVEGWGVSLCWWAAQAGQWDDAKINEIADWLVSPDGLNYNVFRYNIPGGDDPDNAHCTPHHMQQGKGARAEMKGFLPNKDDWNYDWDADIAQIKMLRAIVAKAKEYGKEDILKIEAFSNSCPWWMTVSGCVSGSVRGGKYGIFSWQDAEQETNLKSDYYDDFARYLVDVCKHFKEVEGIEFYTLEPFNEPYANNYWTCGIQYQRGINKYEMGGQQEGCYVKPADQINFVKNFLAPELASASLKTVISVSDETNLELSAKVWDAYKNDGTVLNSVAQWNTHTYDGSDSQRTSLRDKVKAGGKRLWMSETGDMSSGASEWTLCKKLFDDMRNLQPVVWCDWQVMEPHPLWSTIQCGGSNNEFDSNNYWRNLNYYVRKQVTSNIKVGYTILSTSNANVLAAISPDNDEVVVCFLNNGSSDAKYNLSVSSMADLSLRKATITTSDKMSEDYAVSSLSNISVPKQSIVTVVLSRPVSVNVTTAQYATLFYSYKALKVPADVEAYIYTYDDVNNNVESTAYKAGEVIPAGEAVLLHSINKLTATKEFLFDVVDSSVAPNSDNLLKGTDVNQDVQDSNHNCYVLKNNNGHLAFYYATQDGNGKFTNGAHKAYLQLPSTAFALPAMIELDGETSGIMIVNDNDDDNDGFLFNIAGQRVGDNYKGIVIKNGKKFVNK